MANVHVSKTGWFQHKAKLLMLYFPYEPDNKLLLTWKTIFKAQLGWPLEGPGPKHLVFCAHVPCVGVSWLSFNRSCKERKCGKARCPRCVLLFEDQHWSEIKRSLHGQRGASLKAQCLKQAHVVSFFFSNIQIQIILQYPFQKVTKRSYDK